MNLNQKIFQKVQTASKKLVVVTKYLEPIETQKLIPEIQTHECAIGVGENRTESLVAKNLPRHFTHYIGRIQSRKIKDIITHCQVVHSLENLKHAQIFHQHITLEKPVDFFVQVNISEDPLKAGVKPLELPEFLKSLQKFRNLNIIGLSNMGWGKFTTEEKQTEFQNLITLKNKYLPQGKTSAGTSRDYAIALEMGIDIVRIGQAAFSL